MTKKTNWHSSKTGAKFQQWIRDQLESLNLEYIEEKIAHSKATSKRSKGECDFLIKVNPEWHIEAKSHDQTSFKFFHAPCVKGHQLAYLRSMKAKGKRAGILIEFRKCDTMLYFDIQTYDRMIMEVLPRKSFNIAIAKEYGLVVDDMSFVLEG